MNITANIPANARMVAVGSRIVQTATFNNGQPVEATTITHTSPSIQWEAADTAAPTEDEIAEAQYRTGQLRRANARFA